MLNLRLGGAVELSEALCAGNTVNSGHVCSVLKLNAAGYQAPLQTKQDEFSGL